jgi:hypothetical protein
MYPHGLRTAIGLGCLIGAGVLVASELTTLYSVHVVGRSAAVQTVLGGSNNSYAMVPIAVVAVLLGLAALRGGGRLALAALGVVGLVALLIGLLGDLPDAHHTGAIRLGARYLDAAASPSVGMYMETLGAVILIATAGLGLLLAEPAAGAGAGEPDQGGGAG